MKKKLLDKDYKDLRQIAFVFATRKTYPQEAEDFAQYVCLVRFSGKRKTLRLESLWVDYMRRQFGRNLTPSGIFKLNIMRPRPYDIHINDFKSATQPHDEIDFKKYIKTLTDEEKAIIILYIKHEYTCRDLGQAMGLTENRMYHIIQRLLKRIRVTLKDA